MLPFPEAWTRSLIHRRPDTLPGSAKKGKAHKRYEVGDEAGVATTDRGGLVAGLRALPGNPCDGHRLAEALEQVEILTGQRPEMAFVERGCRGNGVENVKVFFGGAKRGVARPIAKLPRRRGAIEPMIGHMKTDGRLTRSFSHI